MIDNLVLGYLTSFIPIVCAVTLLVLRAGASRVFFDVVGTFQANRLIKDAKTASVVFQSLMLDAISGVQEAGQAIGDQFAGMMNSMTPIAREIETARIELEKFLNVTEDTAKVQNEIQATGLDFGFSADQSFQAAARMAQLTGVLGQGSMGIGTEVGMQFGMISNMETEAAMQRMINLQQQTKFMTQGIMENATEQQRIDGIRENSMRVLDQLNTIENRSASTMEQITFVMNQFASQAHLTGESIAAMAAQSAVLIEAGEEQGKGGRALRMIYARLGANTSGAADAFHELGIATKNEEGNLRSLSEILGDLHKIYGTLEDSEKTALAQKVAGNRHYTRFLKLSENYNRALELEFEATMRLSPALEEINRRRQTDLFQLEKAEARLKNMSGAIGNSLIPALTEATNRQADLNAEIAMFLGSGGVGQVVGKMASFGQTFTNAIGPMFNTMVNLQMLTVAMGTYQSVVRALSGDELINQDAYGNKAAAYSTGTAQMMHHAASVQNITDQLKMQTFETEKLEQAIVDKTMADIKSIYTTEQEILGKRQEINLAKEQLLINKKLRQEQARKNVTKKSSILLDVDAKLEKKIKTLDGESRALARNNQAIGFNTRKQLNTAQVLQIVGAEYDELTAKIGSHNLAVDIEREQNRKQMLADTAAQAGAMNNLTMKMGAVGTGFMLFGKGQKSMRIGIVLNTAAMVMQLNAMRLKSEATKKDTVNTAVNIKANQTQAVSFAAVGASAKAAATSIIASSRAVMAAVPQYLALGLAAMAVVEALEFLGIMGDETNLDFDSDLESMDKYKAGTSELIDMIKDESHTIDSLTTSITEKQAELQSLAKFEDTVTKARIEQLHTELGLEQSLLDIKKAQKIIAQEEAGTFDSAALENYFSTLDDIKELQKLNPDDIIPRSFEQLFGRRAKRFEGINWRGELKDAEKDLVDFAKENEAVYSLMQERGIESLEDWEAFIDGVKSGLEILSTAERDAIGIVVDGYTEASDALHEFSNAREELFYGFSSNNLTGNLVKQVVQQGVETLITTTEVIMTNTFNGMTTTEAANQILDEIERGAGLRGMSLSSS